MRPRSLVETSHTVRRRFSVSESHVRSSHGRAEQNIHLDKLADIISDTDAFSSDTYTRKHKHAPVRKTDINVEAGHRFFIAA